MEAEYEAPENPDLTIYGDQESPETAAVRVIAKLIEREYL
jgi:adenylylsulfate kinase-like enzyme